MKDINAILQYEKKTRQLLCLSKSIDLLMFMIKFKTDMLNTMKLGGMNFSSFSVTVRNISFL